MPGIRAMPPMMAAAQIIEDQGEHLVLAIRVPKTLIAENMAFLAVLANRTSGSTPVFSPPIKAPPQRRRARWIGALAASVALGAVILLAPPWEPLAAKPAVPVSVYDTHLVDRTVKVAGELEIMVFGHRRRFCEARIEQTITNAMNKPIWNGRINMIRMVTPEPTTRLSKFMIPAELSPGYYSYSFRVINECPDRRYVATSKSMAFQVVP